MPLTTEQLTLLVGWRALGPAASMPSRALINNLQALLPDIENMLDANGDAIAAQLAGDDEALLKAIGKIKQHVRRVQVKASIIAPHVASLGSLLGPETMATLAAIEAMATGLVPDPPPEPEPEPDPDIVS